ncbi:ACT domain-containing protein [Pelagicoccus sp. SDUM812002]|uniref:ACT domain-containing protein n=1 Tax=Pelagicoccus sp. SDUM812002 TaxID=3041266 RepID=UPI0028121AC5|nr:ACT domain-containing protein [Pelagicoccus sp. SDUM812002]
MKAEKDLLKLLENVEPVLLDGDFVFLSFEQAVYGERLDLSPIVSVREREGLTLVVPREKADANNLVYESVFRSITLSVYSSLEAVGLTAVVAGVLAEKGISANVVAGFHHDHVFVQSERAKEAVAAIASLRRSE